MKYAKSIAVSLGAVLTVLTAALADDVLTVDEGGQIASVAVVQVLTAIAVFGVRNRGYIDSNAAAESYRRGWHAAKNEVHPPMNNPDKPNAAH